MSSIFILCLDSLADYKGHFLDRGSEFSEGKYQISVRKCWGFVPLCPDTPPGCLRMEHPGTPCFQCKVKTPSLTSYSSIFYGKWKQMD